MESDRSKPNIGDFLTRFQRVVGRGTTPLGAGDASKIASPSPQLGAFPMDSSDANGSIMEIFFVSYISAGHLPTD